MSNNNNSGNYFKFKNLQLVHRPNSVRQTRQNTNITAEGTAEEQFAGIIAAACAEALNDIDDLLTDDDSVDYSPPKQQPLEPQVQVKDNSQQVSDSDERTTSTPGSATDSSLDTSSIEVIQPHEGLEIRLPVSPPQRAPPNSPESPQTNVAVPVPDIALGWFETESPTWLSEDQMKQAFLKRFNPWGDTRCQQQDAWNKLKFDMTKDDVDSFVVDMKTLASILGHNDDVITEKFKDIFPDPNIEAALIAMDNFAAMQTKAKQLVQIYKPAHDSKINSHAICLN